MTVDHKRIVAFHGVCNYGPDCRTQPGRLGWGVGTNGYGPMVDTYLKPLVNKTGCRRIFLHNPFPNGGEKEIPIDAPIRMRDTMAPIYSSFVPAFNSLCPIEYPGNQPREVEVIQYHGAATALDAPLTDRDLMDLLDRLAAIFDLANTCQHSIAVDMASALKATKPMALLLPALEIFFRGSRRRVYMEQRRGVDQTYMSGVPTVTMYSELLRQQDRGGEPSLAEFDKGVENILLMDAVPPDRDPLESWDAWVVDQVEAFQTDGFTPAVPTHSMVRRGRFDLLEQLFGAAA